MTALVEFRWSADDDFKKLTQEQWAAAKSVLPQLNLPDKQEDFIWLAGKVFLLEDEQYEFLKELPVQYEVKNMRKLKLQKPVNSEYHIHVPSFGMMNIRHVQVMENACTDMVQELLNEGWRILCICPPLDQRRPDYIIGKGDDA